MDIVDNAVTGAGRVDTLITVLAPTDGASAALSEGAIGTLLMEQSRDQLTEVLTARAVPGRPISAALPGPSSIPMPEAAIAWIGIAAPAGFLASGLRKVAAYGLPAHAACAFPARTDHAWIDPFGVNDMARARLPSACRPSRLLAQPPIVW